MTNNIKDMARIEISLEEYNSFKDKINSLEESIVSKNQKIEELNDKLIEVMSTLDVVLNEVRWSERLFAWKALVKSIDPKLYKVV